MVFTKEMIKQLGCPETQIDYLALAKAQAKTQWHAGEVVWLAQGVDGNGRNTGVFLAESDKGTVEMHVTGFAGSLCTATIFRFSHKYGWVLTTDCDYNYYTWLKRAAYYLKKIEPFLTVPEAAMEKGE